MIPVLLRCSRTNHQDCASPCPVTWGLVEHRDRMVTPLLECRQTHRSLVLRPALTVEHLYFLEHLYFPEHLNFLEVHRYSVLRAHPVRVVDYG